MKSNTKSKSLRIKTIVPSVILEEVTVYGDILSEGAIEIDGRVFGNIRCLSLSLGQKAVVNGNITAERVDINGEVLGDVVAKKIICGSAAKITGNILHQTIHIENGAYIDGNCRKYVVDSFQPRQESQEAQSAPQQFVQQEESQFEPEKVFELVE